MQQSPPGWRRWRQNWLRLPAQGGSNIRPSMFGVATAVAKMARRCEACNLTHYLPDMAEVQSRVAKLSQGEAIALLLAEWVSPSLILVADDQGFEGISPLSCRTSRALSLIKSSRHPACSRTAEHETDRPSWSTSWSATMEFIGGSVVIEAITESVNDHFRGLNSPALPRIRQISSYMRTEATAARQ